MSETQQIQNVKLTEFALRHFDKEFGGTKILNLEPKNFEEQLNVALNLYNSTATADVSNSGLPFVAKIMGGYAPFCKLVAVHNSTDAKVGAIPITVSNYQYIRSGFFARKEGEFDTFSRWIELPVSVPKAKYLMVVLYNREQINKEAIADYNKKIANGGIDSIGLEKPEPFDGDWGVVAILGQNNPEEEPMKPATFDRNYMPIEFGGSGMKYPNMPEKPNLTENSELMRKYNEAISKYQDEMDEIRRSRKRSVDFWSNHVTVK